MDRLRQTFKLPGAEYRGKPFWAWNGELKEEELKRQIRIMKEMGFGGYFMHSRSGLITEYLGTQWFDLINACADEGNRCGMEAWLYDEDRWPSGSAGGMVTEDENLRSQSLYMTEVSPEKYEAPDNILLLFLAKVKGISVYYYESLPLTAQVQQEAEKRQKEIEKTGGDLPGEWKILAFYVKRETPGSVYNGNTYIDTMKLAATERFLELTHEKYAKYCGERIGTSIYGIFTDEPHRGTVLGGIKEENGQRICSIPWTDDLAEEFQKRYGYDFLQRLPEFVYRFHDEKISPVKHDYFDLTDNLFLERYAMPMHQWCKEHNLIFTGHVLHEDSLTTQSVPHGSLMRFYEHMDYPGIDILGSRNYAYWAAKQLSSAARQTGKKWLLSEMYGGTGWAFPMKGHKRMGDWQALFGINIRCHHLSWYTMEGEAKRDFPASILHQAPWHVYYKNVEEYFARFHVLMSEGQEMCDVLVVNPIETIWSQCHMGWTNWLFPATQDLKNIEEQYQQLFYMLMGSQIDFDYGDEQMMASMYSVEQDAEGKAILRIGEASYHVIVVSILQTIRTSTLTILREFMEAGGKVIFAGDVPAYVDAVSSDEAIELAAQSIQVPFEREALETAVKSASNYSVTLCDEYGASDGEVYVQMRQLNHGQGIVFLNLNGDTEKNNYIFTLQGDRKWHLEQWDMESGECYDADSLAEYKDGIWKIHVSIPAAGTKAFVFHGDKREGLLPLEAQWVEKEQLEVTGEFPYHMKEDNVCVLDFVRYRRRGGEWSQELEVLKADRELRDSLGIERRSGDMIQPWFSKRFDDITYGEVELAYYFNIEEFPEGPVFLAAERPELMNYAMNGNALLPYKTDEFWIDDCFKKMEIPKEFLNKGENILTVCVDFRRTTNLEAVYLVGQFGVQLCGHRSSITSLPQMLGQQNLEYQRLPFYTGELTYILKPEMWNANLQVKEGERVLLIPKALNGSMFKVGFGDYEKCLYWDPYEVDVTEAVRKNLNIEFTIIGNRRNVFGPLHMIPKVRAAHGPGEYKTQGEFWSDDYALIDTAFGGVILKKEEKS